MDRVNVLNRYNAVTSVSIGELQHAIAGKIELDVHHINAAVEFNDSHTLTAIELGLQSDDPLAVKTAASAAVRLKVYTLADRLHEVAINTGDPDTQLRCLAAELYLRDQDHGLAHVQQSDQLTLWLVANV